MQFDFAPGERFNFMAAFAQRVGASLHQNTLTLAPSLGTGSIKCVRLTPDFSLLHQYVLTEELILRRTAADNTAAPQPTDR